LEKRLLSLVKSQSFLRAPALLFQINKAKAINPGIKKTKKSNY
jgi:hypothetical protein